MVDVGDRITVASKGEPRSGVVTAVSGATITVRWDTGSEASLIPEPGVGAITSRRRTPSARARPTTSGATAAARKTAPGKRAAAKKAVAKKAVAKKAVAKRAVAKKAVAKRAVAKSAVAKSAVATKAAPGKKTR